MAQLREHPAAGAIPAMRPGEWAAFVADVSERGILEPLRLAADGATVLDGRHRLRAARELGLATVPAAPADCEPGAEVAYMLRAALHRRHLSDDQRAMLGVRLAELIGAERGRAQRRAAVRSRWEEGQPGADTERTTPIHAVSGPDRSRTVAAKALGVSERRLRLARELTQAAPDLAAAVEAGTLPLLVARTRAEHRAAVAQLSAQPPADLPEDAAIWGGDCFELAARIPDGSVDLMLTDPPYGGATLDLWPRLGELAARVLRPGGFLLAYVGHMHLPTELRGLAEAGLEWWWAAAIVFHGHHPAIRARRVRTRWRPVAILRQPPSASEPPWFVDLLATDPVPQKALHPWQQSLGPARALVRRFSLPGQLVLDPFAGAGTFGVAALQEGRRFLGIEADPDHAALARQRLAAILGELEVVADAG